MAGYIVSGRSKILDLTGMTFGHLTVLSFAGKDRCGNKLWLCRCECGTEKTMGGGHLKAGTVVSCGCVGRQRVADASRTHGKSRTTEYNIWCGLRVKPLAKWAKELGLLPERIGQRLKSGWSIERALTTPAAQKRKRGVPFP